jgi:hypothetical protein
MDEDIQSKNVNKNNILRKYMNPEKVSKSDSTVENEGSVAPITVDPHDFGDSAKDPNKIAGAYVSPVEQQQRPEIRLDLTNTTRRFGGTAILHFPKRD